MSLSPCYVLLQTKHSSVLLEKGCQSKSDREQLLPGRKRPEEFTKEGFQPQAVLQPPVSPAALWGSAWNTELCFPRSLFLLASSCSGHEGQVIQDRAMHGDTTTTHWQRKKWNNSCVTVWLYYGLFSCVSLVEFYVSVSIYGTCFWLICCLYLLLSYICYFCLLCLSVRVLLTIRFRVWRSLSAAVEALNAV